MSDIFFQNKQDVLSSSSYEDFRKKHLPDSWKDSAWAPKLWALIRRMHKEGNDDFNQMHRYVMAPETTDINCLLKDIENTRFNVPAGKTFLTIQNKDHSNFYGSCRPTSLCTLSYHDFAGDMELRSIELVEWQYAKNNYYLVIGNMPIGTVWIALVKKGIEFEL